MKLMQIYSNDNKFKWVKFNEQGINVILGTLENKSIKDTDSHNLGKSTLVSLIDFMLLKEIDENFFLRKSAKTFHNYTFFLELKKDNTHFITIKRNVANSTKISFKYHDKPYQDYRKEQNWDYEDLPLTTNDSTKKPVIILNNYLGIETCKTYTYRKILGYFLRTQYDYDEVFKLNKYKGKKVDWLPALLNLLGFDGSILEQKMLLENNVTITSDHLKRMQKELSVSDYEIDVIKSLIEAKQIDKTNVEDKIDKFDFYLKENNISTNLVEEIETEISKLNKLDYRLKYEIEKVKESLNRKTKFDFENIENIFKEVNIYFPDQIKRKYEQLVDFNNQITVEREIYQKEILSEKLGELGEVNIKLQEFNQKRTEVLAALQEKDTFRKFKAYQNELIEIENEISALLSKLDNIDIIKSIRKSIEKMQEDLAKQIDLVLKHLDANNEFYVKIKTYFRELVKEIIGESAILYFKINKNNNPDFHADYVGLKEDMITSQSDGYSYKKMLCVCFDLAILMAYKNKDFFHFVYHDGAYESMSNTRKIKYIDAVRKVCTENNLQYIFTTLEDDLPRDAKDEVYKFNKGEIVLTLTDKPDNLGRLFGIKF